MTKTIRRGLIACVTVIYFLSTVLQPTLAGFTPSALKVRQPNDPVWLVVPGSGMLLPDATLFIQDNNFEGNAAFGIKSTVSTYAASNWWGDVNGPTHASNPLGKGDTVSDNVSFSPWSVSSIDIGIPYSPRPGPGDLNISENSFTGNKTYGVKSTTLISAENNWWGDPSGPNHVTLNPSGKGDKVSNNVDFSPWLTTLTNRVVLSVSQSALDFGDTNSSLSFRISNSGLGDLSWSISENVSWLTVTSFSGSTKKGSYNGHGGETISVVVGRMGLRDGLNTTNIQITSNGGNVTIPVSMQVSTTSASATNSRITIDRTQVLANGVSSALVTVTVKDTLNRPLANRSVQISSSRGSNDSITPLAAKTDSNGQLKANISSNLTGEAEISAVVTLEGITIGQKAKITFYSGQGVDSNLKNITLPYTRIFLDQIKETSLIVASNGDYFATKLSSDWTALWFDLAFSMVELLLPKAKDILTEKAVKIFEMGKPINWRAISNAGVPILQPSVTSRVLKELNGKITPDTYKAITKTMLRNNQEYWASKAKDVARDLAKNTSMEILKEWIKPKGDRTDALYNFYHIGNVEIIEGYKESLNQYVDSVANDLPLIPPQQVDQYKLDIILRDGVTKILADHLKNAGEPLLDARIKREEEDRQWLLNMAVKIIVPVIVNCVFDGPAWVITLGSAAWSLGENAQKISTDQKFYDIGANIETFMVPDTADRIWKNVARGAYNIDQQITPQIAEGIIGNIRDVSKGTYSGWREGIYWLENASYSEVTIENTSDYTAQFIGYAFGSNDKTKFVSENVVEIQPHSFGILKIDWKQNNNGDTPSSASIGVIAVTDTGAYSIGSTSWKFDGERDSNVPAPGSGLSAETLDTVLTMSSETSIQTIQNPINSQIFDSSDNLTSTVQWILENPFPQDLYTELTQALPANVSVKGSCDGQLTNGILKWQGNLQPGEMKILSCNLVYSAAINAQVELPAAQMVVTEIATGEKGAFEGNSVTLTSRFPVVVDGNIPVDFVQRQSKELSLDVTNLSETSTSGKIDVNVKSLTGNITFQSSVVVNLASLQTQTIKLPITINDLPGTYILDIIPSVGSANQTAVSVFIELSKSPLTDVFIPFIRR